MPPKSVWKIVELIKHDYEEWGGERQIDELSLYRHVEEMLALEREPPDLAPTEIVEQQVQTVSLFTMSITAPDGETRTGPIGSPVEIAAAAKWAWVLFHDFFGEYPPTGDEDGYLALVHKVLTLRRPHIIGRLPPLS